MGPLPTGTSNWEVAARLSLGVGAIVPHTPDGRDAPHRRLPKARAARIYRRRWQHQADASPLAHRDEVMDKVMKDPRVTATRS
jgi:hypothetical protein